MVSKRRLHFVRFYDRRRLRKDSHRIRCVFFRKQRRRSSQGFSTLTLFKKEQPKKPSPTMLLTLFGIVNLVQCKSFFSTGRAGDGTGLFQLNQVFVHQTKRPSRRSGAAFLWYGWELYFSTTVTLAPSGMPVLLMSRQEFSTIKLIKEVQQ